MSRLPLASWVVFTSLSVAGTSLVGCMGRSDLTDDGSGEGVGGGSSSGSSSGSSGASGSSGSSGSSSGGTSTSSSSGTGSSSGYTGSSSGYTGSSSGSSSGGYYSSSSSSGSGSSSGTNYMCAGLPVPDVAKVCPDGVSVGGQYVYLNGQCTLEFVCPTDTSCSQGAYCTPGIACVGTDPVPSNCSESCSCAGTGQLQCTVDCSQPSPPPPSCSQGAQCTPGSGCGTAGGVINGGVLCSTSCVCNAMGYMDCSTSCDAGVAPVDAGPPPVVDSGVPDPCPDFAVPDICEVCSNGTTECAHAILVDGMCAVEICPGG